jgi:drug/metabolite transporter (DMT)-like permease
MRKAFIQLHVAVFLAGITALLGKLISLNAVWLVWYRLLITIATLWVLAVFQKNIGKINERQLLQIAFTGAIVALHWVAFYGSIKYANVSIALVCFSLVGFFSSIAEPLLFKRAIARREVLLGLLSVAGVGLIFHFDVRYKTGIIAGVIAALLAALFTVLNKKLLQQHTPQTVTVYELTAGFVVLTILLFFENIFNGSNFVIPSHADWGWLILLSWFCTVLAFILSLKALKKISSFTVNLTYNLEPVYGILLAFIIFKENKYLHTSFYAGLALILAAVVIQMWRVYRKHA